MIGRRKWIYPLHHFFHVRQLILWSWPWKHQKKSRHGFIETSLLTQKNKSMGLLLRQPWNQPSGAVSSKLYWTNVNWLFWVFFFTYCLGFRSRRRNQPNTRWMYSLWRCQVKIEVRPTFPFLNFACQIIIGCCTPTQFVLRWLNI